VAVGNRALLAVLGRARVLALPDATPLLNWFFLQMKILDARPDLLYCIYGGGKEASK